MSDTTDQIRPMGLILAAGRGSRMGSHTDDSPKCLTELAGRTLLEWQLAALHAAGVSRVAVVGGYRRDALQGDFELLVAERWAETNMVRSLMVAEAELSTTPVIVSYSDIVFHPDHVRALTQASGLAITYDTRWLDLWALRFPDPLDDAETFRVEDENVIEIGAQPSTVDEVRGQYMGLLRFDPGSWSAVHAVLDAYPPEVLDRLDMTSLLQALLREGQTIRGVPVDGRWCEVDSPTDLAAYQDKLAQGGGAAGWAHDWRWPED